MPKPLGDDPRHDLPLNGTRVVDLTDGVAASSTRLLAELGADVVLVEPPNGLASRRAHPQHEGIGLPFLTAHANKRGVVLDLATEQGRADLLSLVDGADIVVESLSPGRLTDLGVGPTVMRERNPALVVVSISDFGQSGPYRDWRGTEAVQMAMSSVLTRSGAPDREPLLPPGNFATEAGAVQAACAALIAYYHVLETGSGDYVDCALHDMAVQGLDPGYGMAGTATMGRPISELPPGRPDARMLYPIFPCADGHVRLCMLAPKHWRAMFTWLGEPEEFADPSFEQLITRFTTWDTLRKVIADLLADKTRDHIVGRGIELGIPIASVNTPAEAARSDHATSRNSFVDAEVAPGLIGRMANGFLEFGGERAGFCFRAPTLGEHTDKALSGAGGGVPAESLRSHVPEPPGRPLEGLRVLDLGVIVVGAETGRLLADQGAEVIKVENRAFMDGARQSDTPERVSHGFSVGNRNKLSLGLNLRDPRGAELMRDLIAKSDVLLTNFKPGTMESLGFDDNTLRDLNPRIVVVESSAFGSTGPWSNRMGYGPLVRAAVGLTTLWRHPDSPEGFGDDITVYPDHAAARVAVAAIMAALVARRRSGKGAKITVAQMETVFVQLSTDYLRESLEPQTMVARGNVGQYPPSGVYRCQGEDGYCVVAVDGDADWIKLATAIGRDDLAHRPDLSTAEGRLAHREELDRAVEAWITPLEPHDAAVQLQAAGVAAGAATHVKDLLDDPQLAHRHALGQLPQPGWDEPLTVETGIALFDAIAPPVLNPAPVMAQHTRFVCQTILELSDAEIEQLAQDGVLELAEGPKT